MSETDRSTRRELRFDSLDEVLADADVDLRESLERFQKAVGRLKSNEPTAPHPALGKLTPTEWNALHLRHSELHLSFVLPAS